jgi:hypothetical protein
MKIAIRNEKSKYRFRMTLIKYWAINYIKNIRKLTNNIYNKLNDWIILSNKSENEALNQLSSILRSHIEKEQKIKYELELDTFDIIVNMDIQNFIELPVILYYIKLYYIISLNYFLQKKLLIIINSI